MADIFVSYTKSDRDWAFWRRRHLCLDGGTSRRSRPRALRRLGRLPERNQLLFAAGTPRCAVAGGWEAARLRTPRGRQALPITDAQRSLPALRAVRRAGRRRAPSL